MAQAAALARWGEGRGSGCSARAGSKTMTSKYGLRWLWTHSLEKFEIDSEEHMSNDDNKNKVVR